MQAKNNKINMSVINKKEFFLLWTKQCLKNFWERFLAVYENSLAREIMRDNSDYVELSNFL